MSLEATTGQLLDKLSDLVVGPVQGTVTASLAADVVAPVILPQGLEGTLADGRPVRVRYGRRMRGATSVPVRLLYLTPAAAKAQNFKKVDSGTVVTWRSPPAGIAPTATVVSTPGLVVPSSGGVFGSTSRAAGLKIASCAQYLELEKDGDLFKAGAQGTASLVLLEAEVKPIGGASQAGEQRIQLLEVTWKIRVNVTTLEPDKVRRASAQRLYDNVRAMIQGATVGDSPLQVGTWKLAKRAPGVDAWELQVITQLWGEGRALQPEALEGLGTFDDLDATITLPGDGLEPGPFRVETTTDTGNAFDDGFDDGFG